MSFSIQCNEMEQKPEHEYQRAQCVALKKVGMTCRQISTIVGVYIMLIGLLINGKMSYLRMKQVFIL